MLPLFLVAGPLLAVSATSGNLLHNPGFEEGNAAKTFPSAWRCIRGKTIQWMADGGHSGKRCLRLIDTDKNDGIAVDSAHLPARPGGVYTLRGWLRTRDQCNPGLYVQFFNENGERCHEVHERLPKPSAEWRQVTATATAPEDAVEVSALIYAYIGDAGTFDADDLELTVEGGRNPGTPPFPPAEPGGKKEVVQIGDRLELFVDDFLMDGTGGNLVRRLHHPTVRDIVLELDRPWEGPFCGYTAVVAGPAEDEVRLYYRGWADLKKPAVTCCAVSRDGGRSFTRPDLGIYEFDGDRHNNIVYMGPGTHNFTPFLDANPATPTDARFKALASAGPKNSLVPFYSSDGFHWTRVQKAPVITDGAFDSQNLAFWDTVRGEYVSYFRDFHLGVRAIKRCTSKDFIHWTKPEWLDYGATPREHLYTNAIVPYFRAPHIFLGFPCRFVPGRKKVMEHKENGVNDGVLMSSRDGQHWQRWLTAFLRPGDDPLRWTDRNNYIAWGIAPSGPAEISLYWNEHYRYPTHRLRRGTIRTDGFVSLHADAVPGGEALTRPLIFTGAKLHLNYSTSAIGMVRVELCDVAGEPLPGFSMLDAEVLFGDEIDHVFRWGAKDLAGLNGRPVRIRFRLRDADVFSFRFGP